MFCTLHTTNSGETAAHNGYLQVNTATQVHGTITKLLPIITITVKQTYYLNVWTSLSGTVSLNVLNADKGTGYIKLVSAYL